MISYRPLYGGPLPSILAQIEKPFKTCMEDNGIDPFSRWNKSKPFNFKYLWINHSCRCMQILLYGTTNQQLVWKSILPYPLCMIYFT